MDDTISNNRRAESLAHCFGYPLKTDSPTGSNAWLSLPFLNSTHALRIEVKVFADRGRPNRIRVDGALAFSHHVATTAAALKWCRAFQRLEDPEPRGFEIVAIICEESRPYKDDLERTCRFCFEFENETYLRIDGVRVFNGFPEHDDPGRYWEEAWVEMPDSAMIGTSLQVPAEIATPMLREARLIEEECVLGPDEAFRARRRGNARPQGIGEAEELCTNQ